MEVRVGHEWPWRAFTLLARCMRRDALALSPKDDYSSNRRSLPSGVPFAKARGRWAEAESEASKRESRGVCPTWRRVSLHACAGLAAGSCVAGVND